jgi:site-specific DNA-methyltransferase (adenine-specific)
LLAKPVDLILTDPPFGITDNVWDKKIDLAAHWERWLRVLSPNGTVVVFAAGRFTFDVYASNPKLFRYSLVWQKTNPVGFLNANRMPLRGHEDILVFQRPKAFYEAQRSGELRVARIRNCRPNTTTNYRNTRGGLSIDDGLRHPTSVLRFARDKGFHPTQKPLALLEFLIRSYCPPGGLVLDPFAGSGATAIAAARCDRSFLGWEMDKNYWQKATERIKLETNALHHQHYA